MPKISETQQAQRRAHILDAAEVCFARAGFHRTTMQDICREAKVSAGALYLYFASKEALIDGIVARDREEMGEELARMETAPDLMAGMEQSLRTCVLERPAHKVALYIEMLAEAGRNPHIAAAMNACEAQIRGSLEVTLATARAQGRIAAGADPKVAAHILMMLGDGLFLRRARPGDFDVRAVVPHMLEMIRTYLDAARPQPLSVVEMPLQAGAAE